MRYLKALQTTLVLAASVFFLSGGVANAYSAHINIAGQFTAVPAALVGTINVGDPFGVTLFVDSNEANLALSPDFNATSVGTLSAVLIVPIGGTVDDVALNDGAGVWTSATTIDLSSLGLPLLPQAITLNGTGNTPGQILPDFTSLTSGTIVINAVAVWGENIEASVTGVNITPEPGTALLLGLGLAGMAGYRRRLS